MNTFWVVDPLVQLAVLAIGLAGSLTLWVSVKFEARATEKAFEAFRESAETTMKALEARIEEMKTIPEEDPAPAAVVIGQALNLTTRAKVLRMARRGETTSSIAAALGIQQEEVELLLKLDRMLNVTAA